MLRGSRVGQDPFSTRRPAAAGRPGVTRPGSRTPASPPECPALRRSVSGPDPRLQGCPAADARWVVRPGDGPDVYGHNSMRFNIFQPPALHVRRRKPGKLRKDYHFVGQEKGPTESRLPCSTDRPSVMNPAARARHPEQQRIDRSVRHRVGFRFQEAVPLRQLPVVPLGIPSSKFRHTVGLGRGSLGPPEHRSRFFKFPKQLR